MTIADRIIPAEALRWGRLTQSWAQTLTVTLRVDTSGYQRAMEQARRAVLNVDPDRLFRFEQKWERPDANPFPRLSLLPWRKRHVRRL